MNFIRRSTLAVTLITIMLSSALVFAKITHTLLVTDMANDSVLPKHFRTTSDVLPDAALPSTGLASLHSAGSQQFSSAGLKAALAKIPSKSIIIVDLRRESHGYLNGGAVSWYGPQNAANENKSPEQIKKSESRLLGRVEKSRFRWVYEITEKTDDGFIERVNKDFVRVNSVASEQELADKNHLGYKRFYVEDYHAPEEADATRFVNFINHLPENTWLYFHCRAGKGRTTTFLSMYDMMKNAKQVSFEDILKRQAALGGEDLMKLPNKKAYKYKAAVHRLNFLKKFYEYAKTNNDDFSTTWSQWLHNKS
jgi:protein-tyrosine phosphatase